jgi:hypothetical protein
VFAPNPARLQPSPVAVGGTLPSIKAALAMDYERADPTGSRSNPCRHLMQNFIIAIFTNIEAPPIHR